jgi:monomeric sarcosine oxidase
MPNKPSRRAALKGLIAGSIAGSLPEQLVGKHAFEHPQIAVIGAGAFGGWTAYHLMRKGAKVTLVDSWGAGNSRASSGGETRVIRGIYGADRVYTQWVKRSFDLWKEAEVRWKAKLYHRTGLLWMFSTDDAYARLSLPILRDLGLSAHVLTVAEAGRRYPQINFTGVRTCYYEDEAGHLAARRACQVLCEQFQNEGGQYRQTEARPGEIRGQVMSNLLLSDRTRLNADQYVFACGPWLGKVFPDVVGGKVQPSRQEVYFFGTSAGDTSFQEPNLPIWIDFDERVFYGIPSAENRGFKVADDTRGEPFDPTDGNRTPSNECIERARTFLRRRFPRLSTSPLLEARVCQYENSPDGHFIIDRHPEAKNVWLIGGGSGHGFKLSPALGEHIAELVLDAATPDPFFGLKRFSQKQGKTTQFDLKK